MFSRNIDESEREAKLIITKRSASLRADTADKLFSCKEMHG